MRYLALLRIPGAARLAVAALVGRIPMAMVPLATILLLRSLHKSFALAGSVVAAYAIAAGLAAIPQGRLVDRLGQTRVLTAFACVYSAAVVAMLLAARASAPSGVLIAVGVVMGAAIPPLSASMRTLWTVLTEGEQMQTAFALEAVLQEAFYITGPLLVAAIVALASPDAAIVVAAVMALAGTLLFASSRLSRARRGGRSEAGRLGALGAPGLRTLVLALLPVGIAFGAVEVTVPAFAEAHGSTSASGVLIALYGAGSMVGGLWYGARSFSASLESRFAIGLAALAALLIPVALASSFVAAGIAIFAAGMPIAPAFGTSYTLIDRLAPPGTMTEAFTITTTSIVVGVALGNAAAGALVEPIGTNWTFAAAAAVAALAPLSAVARRRTLAPVPAA